MGDGHGPTGSGGAGDDGLAQRFQLLVWPDVGRHWEDMDRPPNRRANPAFTDKGHTVRYSVAVANAQGPFHVEAEATGWETSQNLFERATVPGANETFSTHPG